MTEQDELSRTAKGNGETDDTDSLRQSLARLRRKLDDQSERIEALARGREESMAAVSELRAELRLVAAERDKLRKELTALEGMQTETQTLDDDAIDDDTGVNQGLLPSIDELMATFSGSDNALSASHSTLRVDNNTDDDAEEYQEMISPDLIVLGSRRDPRQATVERFLVLLDPAGHTKCSLNQDLLTIGRSDSADIKVDGDFISRIHARILRIGVDTVIEDAGSKNGTRVNTRLVDRHVLRHGDLVRVGSANFRYVDSAAGDADGE
jgi:hypothetical protein